MGTKSDLLEVLPFFSQKKLKAVVDSMFHLKDTTVPERLGRAAASAAKVIVAPE